MTMNGKILDLSVAETNTRVTLGGTPDPPEDLFKHFEAPEDRPPPEEGPAQEDDEKAEETMSDMGTSLKNAFLDLQERYSRTERLAGAESGFTELDDIVDGWQKQRVTLVGARSGMGKSIFGLNLGLRLSSQGHMVDYITIEMPSKQQALRALFCWGKVQSHRMKFKTMNKGDWSKLAVAINEMKNWPWIWDDRGSTTIDQIRRQIQIVKRKAVEKDKDLHTVIIDHILNIKGLEKQRDRRQEVLYITNQLKAIAKEEDVCMIGLTQINRGVEGHKNKRPTISHLKESGSSEEDADNILLLYREDYYTKEKDNWDHVLEVDVAKVRDGEPGIVRFHEDFNRYRIEPIRKDDCEAT